LLGIKIREKTSQWVDLIGDERKERFVRERIGVYIILFIEPVTERFISYFT